MGRLIEIRNAINLYHRAKATAATSDIIQDLENDIRDQVMNLDPDDRFALFLLW